LGNKFYLIYICPSLLKNKYMKQIKSPYATISYKAPIVSYSFKKGVELGFPEMLELIAHAEALSNHKPYVVLSDMRRNVQVTPEGKRTVADKNKVPLTRGSAMLVKEPELKSTANFFSEKNNPAYPFRAFTSRRKAIEWLRKLPVKR
jgi:hypothetical protein